MTGVVGEVVGPPAQAAGRYLESRVQRALGMEAGPEAIPYYPLPASAAATLTEAQAALHDARAGFIAAQQDAREVNRRLADPTRGLGTGLLIFGVAVVGTYGLLGWVMRGSR